MEVKGLYPDRICTMCREARGWIHFAPFSPYAKAWNSTCFPCRKAIVREALPEDWPSITCFTCGKEKDLRHFIGESRDREPAVLESCYTCRLKARKQAQDGPPEE